MFNEVFKRCPKCAGRGYMQIHQIVLEFGNFDLDDLTTLSELDIKQKLDLLGTVLCDSFTCEECGHHFKLELGDITCTA